MTQAVQHVVQHLGFHLRDAPTNGNAVLEFLGFPDLDDEAMLENLAASRAHVELHDMIAVAQTARRAMERVAAAQRIGPIGKRRTHILARQAIMRLTETLIVEQHIDADDARAGQCPSLDGETPGDRFGHRAGDHGGVVDLQAKLRLQRWRRLGALDQHGAHLLADVVEAVAQYHAQFMLARRHVAQRPGKTEARIARHRNVTVLGADIVARQAQVGVAHCLAVEIHGDRRDAGRTDRPTSHAQIALGSQVQRVAEEADLPARILRRWGNSRRRRDRRGQQR